MSNQKKELNLDLQPYFQVDLARVQLYLGTKINLKLVLESTYSRTLSTAVVICRSTRSVREYALSSVAGVARLSTLVLDLRIKGMPNT